MTRNPGMDLITPVDPQLLNENGDKDGQAEESSVTVVNPGARVAEQKREKMPSKHSEISIAKRNRIARKKKSQILAAKHHRLTGRKSKKSQIQRPHNGESWKYSKHANLNNQTLTKRSMILTKKLPPEVDQLALEIDGFVCTCPEHYRGKKCERKLKSSTLISLQWHHFILLQHAYFSVEYQFFH